jgi:hypothetical protein
MAASQQILRFSQEFGVNGRPGGREPKWTLPRLAASCNPSLAGRTIRGLMVRTVRAACDNRRHAAASRRFEIHARPLEAFPLRSFTPGLPRWVDPLWTPRRLGWERGVAGIAAIPRQPPQLGAVGENRGSALIAPTDERRRPHLHLRLSFYSWTDRYGPASLRSMWIS